MVELYKRFDKWLITPGNSFLYFHSSRQILHYNLHLNTQQTYTGRTIYNLYFISNNINLSAIAQFNRPSHQYIITHIGSDGGFMQLCYCDSISYISVLCQQSVVQSFHPQKQLINVSSQKETLCCNRFLIKSQASNHMMNNRLQSHPDSSCVFL